MTTVQDMATALAAEDADDGDVELDATQQAAFDNIAAETDERRELEAACDFIKDTRIDIDGVRWEPYATAPLEREGCIGVCLRRVR
jgi:hypothetical protein